MKTTAWQVLHRISFWDCTECQEAAYGSLLGSSASSSDGLYGSYGGMSGLGMGSLNGFGSSINGLSMLLGMASADEGGDTVSLSKESFASMVEILRIQMLMNASRSAGNVTV